MRGGHRNCIIDALKGSKLQRELLTSLTVSSSCISCVSECIQKTSWCIKPILQILRCVDISDENFRTFCLDV